VQPRRRGLAGDSHDWRAIHIGVGQAGDEAGAGSEGHTHAGAAGQPSVDVGRTRALLVMGRHELDRAVEQGVHDVDVLFAGTPKMNSTPRFEAFDQEPGGAARAMGGAAGGALSLRHQTYCLSVNRRLMIGNAGRVAGHASLKTRLAPASGKRSWHVQRQSHRFVPCRSGSVWAKSWQAVKCVTPTPICTTF
jgi:hypothetical protein